MRNKPIVTHDKVLVLRDFLTPGHFIGSNIKIIRKVHAGDTFASRFAPSLDLSA